MSSPKICYVSSRMKLETNLEQLSSCIAIHGYDVTIINVAKHSQEDKIDSYGRKIVYLDMPASFFKNGRLQTRINRFRFFLNAFLFLRRCYFDIIHIDSGCHYYSLLKLASIKAKLLYHIQSLPISSNKSSLHFFKGIFSTFVQSLIIDAVIIQSNEQKKKWIGTRRLRKTRIVPIGYSKKVLFPLCNSQKRFLKKEMNISQFRPIFIYAGVISRLRELERLIHAFSIVKQHNQEILLLMVGDGDAVRDLKSLATSLDLANNIIFTGGVAHEDMVKYYGISDIGISYVPINSNYDYNPPLKTIEYLACGLACIATETKSNRKFIQDGNNGILVKDTSESISQAALHILYNKHQLTRLKINAPMSIESNEFDIITKNYLLPIYTDLLNSERGLRKAPN